MVFHIVAFRKQNLGTTESVIPPVRDETIMYDDEGIMVPTLNKVLWLYAQGAGLASVRLDSPSLRDIGLEDVPTFNIGDSFPVVEVINEAGSNTRVIEPCYGICDYGASPLTLTSTEKLIVKGQGTTAGADTIVVLCLGDSLPTPVSGNIRTIKATVNVTTTPYEWSSGTLTLTQSLKSGTYDLVGLIVPDPRVITARVIFPGAGWRPGILGTTFTTSELLNKYLFGNFGVYGSFTHIQLPQLELLTTTTITNPVVYLQLIKRA